jgi:hypothetical protein
MKKIKYKKLIDASKYHKEIDKIILNKKSVQDTLIEMISCYPIISKIIKS